MNGMNNLKISRAAIKNGCIKSSMHQAEATQYFQNKLESTDQFYLRWI